MGLAFQEGLMTGLLGHRAEPAIPNVLPPYGTTVLSLRKSLSMPAGKQASKQKSKLAS
jgi:hypothetical protein